MGKQSTTPPVDPTIAAEKTAAGNLQAAKQNQAANMVNQITPTGSVTYTPTYYNSQGQQIQAGDINPRTGKPYNVNSKDVVIRYDQKVNLTPEQQALFNQGQRINQGLGNLAENQGMAQITNALNNPLTSDIPITSNVDLTADQMVRGVETPELQTQVPTFANEIRTESGANERASGDIANNANQLVRNIQDPNLLLQDTTNALYKANTQFLDPQFQRGQADLENKLANQGITPGSEAYNRAMQDFSNQKQQAYESARNQAIAGGMNAAQGMFGMNLQGGQFTNQALGQEFGQGLSAQQLANAAAQQNNQMALAKQQAYNQALGQKYGQTLGGAQFGNQALLSGFGMDTQNANLNNQVLQQLFGQRISNANLQNAASNQQLTQEQLRQQAPINIINALRSGQQMQVAQIPQVAVSAPGQMAVTSGPDYLGAANAANDYAANAAAANAQTSSGIMSGVGSIVGGMI